jgi:uncharacterized membrane protein
MKRNVQTVLLLVHFALFMIYVGGALFETFINFPNWVADIPASLTRTREFLAVRHPGMFFQLVVPLTILTGILFALIAWRSGAPRNYVGASILLLIGIELLTFNLVYPRIGILLGRGASAGLTFSTEQLNQAAQQLLTLNAWRLAVTFLAALLSATGLVKFLSASVSGRREP